jgi:hypothetical protein
MPPGLKPRRWRRNCRADAGAQPRAAALAQRAARLRAGHAVGDQPPVLLERQDAAARHRALHAVNSGGVETHGLERDLEGCDVGAACKRLLGGN